MKALIASVFLISTLPFVRAQSVSLTGTVVSIAADAVPEARIKLANQQGGAELSTKADDSGRYAFSQISAGLYDLSVSAPGFRPYARFAVQVPPNGVRMEVRLIPEKEDVAQAAPLSHLGFHPTANNFADLLFAQDLLKARPGSGIARLLEASAKGRTGRLQESRELLEQMLNENPNDTDALLLLATLDLVQKRNSDAEEPFRRAYRLDPSDLRGLEGLAEIRFINNQPAKAVELIAAEAAKDPKSYALRHDLVGAEIRAGQVDQAIAECQRMLQDLQGTPAEKGQTFFITGYAYQSKGDLDHAIEYLKKATEIAPEKGGYHANLGGAYERAGKAREALAEYRAALKSDPDNAALLNNAAFQIANTGGDLEEALRMVQKARRQAPNALEIQDTLAWVYLKKGLIDSAISVLSDVVAKEPNNAAYHYHYGAALAGKGDAEGARKELNLALENKPGKEDEAAIKELLAKIKP